MDFASLDSSDIHASVVNSQSVSSISVSENNQYNHKWKLYYDKFFEQYFQKTIDPTTA